MATNKVLVEFQIIQKGKNFSIIQKEQQKHNKTLDKTDKKTKDLTKTQDRQYTRQKQGVIATANSTKNFSKMQQTVGGDGGGPGGLVRSYALLAANVFALTAAFGVLSRAAQVDVLNESMEVLSTTGGTYIKNLAKEMQAASGHAIDLAQSFRQVSLAASAGLNTEEIEGLTMVAKGAAISLGRNLPDAMDRIFRGAIKLEPEILDEIGLFVRVDEAAQKYARNHGKVVSALTQVEKRQAFLNEILEQGTKKFQQYAEEIQPDSFVRLGAALADIAQSGLSMLNKPLTTFIEMLVASKGILAVVFGGLVALLAKRVVPAMGLMTKSSAEAAHEAAENAKKYSASLNTTLDDDVKKEDKRLKDRRAKLNKSDKLTFKQTAKQSRAQGAAELKGQASIAKLEAKRTELQKQRMHGQTSHAQKKLLQKDIASLDRIIERKKQINKLTNEIDKNQTRSTTNLAAGSAAARAQEKLDRSAFETGAIATATGVGETQGWVAGRAELYAQLDKEYKGMDKSGKETQKSLGRVRKRLTAVKGEVSLATGQINKMMAIMGPWIMLFTMAAAALAMTAKWFGINDKRSQAFSESLKKNTDLIENVNKRFDAQTKAMANVAMSYKELNNASIAYNKNQMELARSLSQIQEDFNVWKRSASGAALALDNFVKKAGTSTNILQEFLTTGGRAGLPIITRLITGDSKEQKRVTATIETSKAMLTGMLKAGDASGLDIFRDLGVVLDGLIEPQNKYKEALDRTNIAETAVKESTEKLNEANRVRLGLILEEAKNKGKLSSEMEEEIELMEDASPLLVEQARARWELFKSTGELEKKVTALNVSEKQGLEGGKRFMESSKDRVKAGEMIKSALDGATESIGKFNQSFMPKTKVDDIVGSFMQINAALKEKDKQEKGTGRDAFFADFAAADNPFRSLISGSMEDVKKGGKVVGRQLKQSIRDSFKDKTDAQIFEILFKRAEEATKKYRVQIMLSKVQIAEFTKQAKRYNSISAGGLSVNRKEQKALLNIQKQNLAIAKSETEVALVNQGLDRTSGTELLNQLANAKSQKEQEIIMMNAGKSRLDILQLQGVFIAENTAIMEKQLKEATHLFEAEQARLKALQKVVAAQKELTTAKLAEVKLEMQLANLEKKGTIALSPGDEAKLAVESATKKLGMFLAEAKIKRALLDIEEKIVLARLRVLAESDPQLKAEFKLIEKQLKLATTAGKAALDTQMTNAAKRYSIELAQATTKAFETSLVQGIRTAGIVGRAEITEMERTRAERRKKAISDAVDASNAAGGTFKAGIAAGVEGGKAFDKQEEEDVAAKKRLHTQQLLRESLMASAEMFKTMGPEGEFISSVIQGTFTISDAFVEMGKIMDNASDGIKGSFEKASAGAEFASAAIGAVGSIMAANSAQQVAAIDKQIAAEQKRDGKSAASLAKIKQLEGKKLAMQRKAFNQNKKMMMAQAVANTAAAITQTFADKGYPAGIPFAAVMAAIGAIQLALIAKTSFQGGSGEVVEPKATALTIGGRSDKVDVSKRVGAGELSYLRGERGIGTTSTNFRPGGAAGMKRNYASGGIMVGEQGPEILTSPVNVIPNEDMNRSRTTNINFSINAVDGVSVQNMLYNQQGNIISMIREAANDNGEGFLETVDDTVYNKEFMESGTTGGFDYASPVGK